MSTNTLIAANPQFDQFAENYDVALDQGISVAGESKEYFARGRVNWLSRRLTEMSVEPRRVLDFGCGTGSATPFLLNMPGVQRFAGVDISERSLEVAQREHGSENVRFELTSSWAPSREFDVAFCNGVFHHIPIADRSSCASYVFNAVRPGGLFALWENNPWNPGTRYIMSRIPFDRDAIMLSAPETRRLLATAGFQIVRTDFVFFFPGCLRRLRALEPRLCGVPFGAQYLVLARRPA